MDAPPDSPDGLRERIRLLEEENATLERKVDEEQCDARVAWEDARRSEDLLDRERRHHLGTKKAGLEFMRKIEWCQNGKCPVCGFGQAPGMATAPRHATACELKLAIWRLESATLPGTTLRIPAEAR